ncbi:MAG: MBL fold metallo-hydrolase [Candidatus Thorarchaeota archaeon]|nr:MBL fold metallo-hydrolase [Candidatus Thorarchaeota archaeon]
MKITMLGTGTSYPDPERVQSGILIESDNENVLLDIGSGVLHRLTQLQFDLGDISAIFISHFHVDHCSDFLTLCQSMWLTHSEEPLRVYGPPFIHEWSRGVRDIAFPYLTEKLDVQISRLNENEITQVGDISVSNCPTIHSTVDTRAFRVESEGKSIVFSSDTAPCRSVVELARNTDILIHECNWLDGPHPEGVHTSPSELTQIIEDADPARVVLTHLSPDVVQNTERVLEIVSRRTEAKVVLAHDLQSFEI